MQMSFERLTILHFSQTKYFQMKLWNCSEWKAKKKMSLFFWSRMVGTKRKWDVRTRTERERVELLPVSAEKVDIFICNTWLCFSFSSSDSSLTYCLLQYLPTARPTDGIIKLRKTRLPGCFPLREKNTIIIGQSHFLFIQLCCWIWKLWIHFGNRSQTKWS